MSKNELIKIENDKLIFGTPYEKEKQKVKGFEAFGNVYNVKSYNEATRLEKNDAVIIETVPGSTISEFDYNDKITTFDIEGFTSTQVTLKLNEKTDYKAIINGVSIGNINSGTAGKVTFSVELVEGESVSVSVKSL